MLKLSLVRRQGLPGTAVSSHYLIHRARRHHCGLIPGNLANRISLEAQGNRRSSKAKTIFSASLHRSSTKRPFLVSILTHFLISSRVPLHFLFWRLWYSGLPSEDFLNSILNTFHHIISRHRFRLHNLSLKLFIVFEFHTFIITEFLNEAESSSPRNTGLQVRACGTWKEEALRR